jgi:hypothetical protein
MPDALAGLLLLLGHNVKHDRDKKHKPFYGALPV